jgi:hypothetical protein
MLMCADESIRSWLPKIKHSTRSFDYGGIAKTRLESWMTSVIKFALSSSTNSRVIIILHGQVTK